MKVWELISALDRLPRDADVISLRYHRDDAGGIVHLAVERADGVQEFHWRAGDGGADGA